MTKEKSRKINALFPFVYSLAPPARAGVVYFVLMLFPPETGGPKKYIRVAQKRIDAVLAADLEAIEVIKRQQIRIPFGALLENGLLKPGRTLYIAKNGLQAKILANGHIHCGKVTGSIHGVAKTLMADTSVNGWDGWFYKDENGEAKAINGLREHLHSIRNLHV